MDTADEIKKSLEKMQARFSKSKWTATEANKFIKSELGEKFSEKDSQLIRNSPGILSW